LDDEVGIKESIFEFVRHRKRINKIFSMLILARKFSMNIQEKKEAQGFILIKTLQPP
jgi:hypothetical protein